jgi:flagellar biosynthesis protein FlhA
MVSAAQPTQQREPADLVGMILKRSEALLGFALLGSVFILLFPLPTWMIDGLLSLAFAISILLILSIAYLKNPTDFFVFPTILLMVTLFRLGLNIATTRSILVNGEGGALITAFGQFVVQGNMIVGLIVFSILTIINFVVITKGAGRVAEVSARFTLDALPGKQMSIDADLNAGLISESEARERRKALERETNFYGAMDGASKFVKGDAVAGLLITTINLVGGIAVGILQMGLTAGESAQRFTLLSIGDGLVSQIPALLISTAAGVLITRSNSGTRLDKDVTKQLLSSRRAMLITGVILWLMILVPGFPKIALFMLGTVFLLAGRMLPAEVKDASDAAPGTAAGAAQAGTAAATAQQKGDPKTSAVTPTVEPFVIELAIDLLPLAQGNLQTILDRIQLARKTLSSELGISIPAISLRDNSLLSAKTYRFLLRGHEIATGELQPGQLLAMGIGATSRGLRGRATTEPAFGLPATWIFESDRREAESLGYAVVDPVSVMITHLTEVLRNNAAELLTRQETQKLVDALKETNGAVLQEMAALQVGIGTVHRVLQNLIREGVSIRDLPVILEKICDHFPYSKHPDELAEAARKVLVMDITERCEIVRNKLRAVTLTPDLEQQLLKCVRQTTHETALIMDPNLARHVHDQLRQGIAACNREGCGPVVLCAPNIRLGLRRFFADTFPNLRFIAYNELHPKVQLQPVHSIPAL